MGKDTKADYSYDDLGEGRFRIRLHGKHGLRRQERSHEFAMLPGWRFPELRERLGLEAEKLRQGK